MEISKIFSTSTENATQISYNRYQDTHVDGKKKTLNKNPTKSVLLYQNRIQLNAT